MIAPTAIPLQTSAILASVFGAEGLTSARIETASGQVNILHTDGTRSTARPGDALLPGDWASTQEDSHVEFVIETGPRIVLVQSASISIIGSKAWTIGGEPVVLLRLPQGGGIVSVSPANEGASGTVVLEMPLARIVIRKGTAVFQLQEGLGLTVAAENDADGSPPDVLIETSEGSLSLDKAGPIVQVTSAAGSPVFLAGEPCSSAFAEALQAYLSPCSQMQESEESVAPLDAFETSAGGEEDALPGDLIQVTGSGSFFDLSPSAPVLSSPLSPADGTTTSLESVRHSAEALFFQQPSEPSEAAAAVQPSRIVEIEDFGTDFSRWQGLNPSPTTAGDYYRVIPTYGHQYGSRHNFSPRDEPGMLVIGSGPLDNFGRTSDGANGSLTPDVEEFLGLPREFLALRGFDAANAAAARTSRTLTAGQVITFSYLFDARDDRSDLDPDQAVFTISHGSSAVLVPLVSEGPGHLLDLGTSGWWQASYRVESSGTYTLGFLLLDDRETDDDSRLLVDDVRIANGTTPGESVGFTPLPTARDDAAGTAGTVPVIIPILANELYLGNFNMLRISQIEDVAVRPGTTVNLSSGASVTVYVGGRVRYSPPDGRGEEEFTDRFAYRVSDGTSGSDSGTVSITVRQILPEIREHTSEDTALVNAGPSGLPGGAILNDAAPETDFLEGSSALGAFIIIHADGTYSYDPSTSDQIQSLRGNESALDSFSYTFEDDDGTFQSGVVTVALTGENDAPVAQGNDLTTSEQAIVDVNVLANDSDADRGDTLRIIGVLGSTDGIGTPVRLASGAEVTVHADGRLSYEPKGHLSRLRPNDELIETVDYTVADDSGATASATVRITVTGVNDSPIAVEDRYVSPADRQLRIGIEAPGPRLIVNDQDPEGDTLTARPFQGMSSLGAAVQVFTDGSFRYDPQDSALFRSLGQDQTVDDHFAYRIDDGSLGEATGTVIVTVSGVNDAPKAVKESLLFEANRLSETSSPVGLLANDADPDQGDSIRIVSARVDGVALVIGIETVLASGATIRIGEDGAVRFDPTGSAEYQSLGQGSSRSITLTYTIRDDFGSESTTDGDADPATITVFGRNDPPVASADNAETDRDSAVRIRPLRNDDDADGVGDVLQILSFDLTSSLGAQIRIRSSVEGDYPTFTYDPSTIPDDLFASGRPVTDAFSYVLGDTFGDTDVGTVTITLHPVSSRQTSPQELLLSFEADDRTQAPGVWEAENQAVSRVMSEFTAEGSTFAPTHLHQALFLEAGRASRFQIEDHLSNGSDSLRLIQLPNAQSNVSGSAVRMDLSVSRQDLSPTQAITLSFDWNFVSLEGDFPNGRNLPDDQRFNDFAVFTITDGVTGRVFTLSDTEASGFGPTGWRTSVYTLTTDFPLPFTGEKAFTLGFAVLNDHDEEKPSILLIDNVRLNRVLGDDHERVPNSGGDGSFSTWRQTPQVTADSRDVSASGLTLINGTSLLANDQASRGVLSASLAIVAVADARGHASLTSDGAVRYDPGSAFRALAEGDIASDAFTYTVTDGNRGQATATVSVTVQGVNDGPTAQIDIASTTEKDTLTLNVLANDSDPDQGDTLRVTSVNGIPIVDGAPIVLGSGAILMLGSDGTLHYDPNGRFDSLPVGATATEDLTYIIADRLGAGSTARIILDIRNVNDTPLPSPDHYQVTEDQVRNVPGAGVLINDRDPDGTALRVRPFQGLSLLGAAVTVRPDGSFDYDSRSSATLQGLRPGESLDDTFIYHVDDGSGGMAESRVTVQVMGLNDQPMAVFDAVSAAEDRPSPVPVQDLLPNDSDPDRGDTVRVVSLDDTQTLGTVTLEGEEVLYDPGNRFQHLSAGETATDRFDYVVSDDHGSTSRATVQVTVQGANDVPLAEDDSGTTTSDKAIIFNVLANDQDPDLNDSLVVTTVDTVGTVGQVTHNADGTITYDPRGRFPFLDNGETFLDTFGYAMDDGHGGTDSGLVAITVTGNTRVERLISSFETPISLHDRSSSLATIAASYQEPDGDRGTYAPTDGAMMARIESRGSTRPALETFLGIGSHSLGRDTDGTFSATGSATRLTVSVQAGDSVSFDWMFDAGDTLPDNDYAVFTVVNGGSFEVFTLSDVRRTGSNGASGWHSSVYTAPTAGLVQIGFAAIDDRTGGDSSYLLVDNVRVNREFDDSYQVVETRPDGAFETLVHT
jgi:VCBS repeat-containing protein